MLDQQSDNLKIPEETLSWSGTGKAILNPFANFYHVSMEIIGLISVALKASTLLLNKRRRQLFYALFQRQVYNAGVSALYVNGVIGFLIGTLLISRLFDYLPRQIIEDQFGQIFMVVVFRELGPLISGIILIARSATAITSEIGYLRLQREFQVLNGLGINPVFLFLLPVFFAFPVSLFLMFIYFDVIVFLSSFAVVWISDPSISFTGLLANILSQITLNEIAINAVKAILGGMLIGIISIYFGAKVVDSFTEVTESISKATTAQLLVFFIINVLLSLLAYTQ
ncbi:MAG: ABC transporter permease [Gammaproteobacteria bacterium]|jgi:phospholipid/cholesterol/gamma-HCH transport system permease protein|nr:ABC transporter permease [Gammaproteobacteria bacterium]MBT5202476.1 ABC transporter permease [Gammaproteobacteria bacterium]MBT5601900.1 ABC transporter permease [Gammaproteobacteria bacterium]MBT6246614.1 ABC transporter permease [Gammaproteobacteria bacterium]